MSYSKISTNNKQQQKSRKHVLPRITKITSEFGRYALILSFTLIFIVPFIWILFWALKTEAEIGANPFLPPETLHWENFSIVWNKGNYNTYLPNTVFYASMIVLGVSTLSCLAGYSLARIKFPGQKLFFNVFLIGLMVPFFSVMIPQYLLARDLKILGTHWGLILPSIGLALPFGIFLMRSFFKGLPEELSDAARIDGCTEWGVFWYIMLPLARSGLSTLIVFEFLWSWNMYVEPLLLVQRDALRPVGLAILLFQGRYTTDRGMVATGLLLTILPVIILYLIFQRKFVEGITAGALK